MAGFAAAGQGFGQRPPFEILEGKKIDAILVADVDPAVIAGRSMVTRTRAGWASADFWCTIVSGQESPRFFFLAKLRRRPRVERLHARNLVGGEGRQSPNEVHETPARLLAFVRAGAPRGHAGQANAVFDN